jgi:dienelactone hydrolase
MTQPKNYPDPIEIRFNLQSGKYELPAILSIPEGRTKPCPAVVLVHGSGNADMDETIHVNKPFRDLARGLSCKGIAVLRYDKRTFKYAREIMDNIKTLTVKEETIDDAKAAVEWLSKREEIDSRHIYLLGHSLGGMLAPRIAAESGKIAGFISMAGSPRRLEDILIDQVRIQIPDKPTSAINNALEIKLLDNMSEIPVDRKISHFYATYWKDLNSYDAGLLARNFKGRILILHGRRDIQVYLKDYIKWRTELAGHKRTKYHFYMKLNHLFIEGRGKSKISEYKIRKQIPYYVMNDIADWIHD